MGDELEIESLDLEGQGVARRADAKVVFVEGALPGERVTVQTTRRKAQWEQACTVQVLRASPQRVTPRCPHFGLHQGACGGCKLQHLDAAAQVAAKQRVLEDQLWHLAKVRPSRVMAPLHGPTWAYRHRARLSVRYVHKKATVLVGFHERKSSYVADMHRCEVLPAHVSGLLEPLRALIATLEARERLPQIEVAVGDQQVALVLRHLVPLSQGDLQRLRQFEGVHGIRWWLQPAGPDSAHPMEEGPGTEQESGWPHYALREFGLRIPFKPTEFTQVNAQVNEVLVSRAVRLLGPKAQDRVVDWFCGLGNFSLPLAQLAGSVLGVEGSAILVHRARRNASLHGLGGRAEFAVADLFQIDAPALQALGPAARWLIDPPREGAFALVKALADLTEGAEGSNWADSSSDDLVHADTIGHEDSRKAWHPPERIVYVSCNPATLARDAGLLVHRAGYRLSQAGIFNMFPHTAHVESMAVFERP